MIGHARAFLYSTRCTHRERHVPPSTVARSVPPYACHTCDNILGWYVVRAGLGFIVYGLGFSTSGFPLPGAPSIRRVSSPTSESAMILSSPGLRSDHLHPGRSSFFPPGRQLTRPRACCWASSALRLFSRPPTRPRACCSGPRHFSRQPTRPRACCSGLLHTRPSACCSGLSALRLFLPSVRAPEGVFAPGFGTHGRVLVARHCRCCGSFSLQSTRPRACCSGPRRARPSD